LRITSVGQFQPSNQYLLKLESRAWRRQAPDFEKSWLGAIKPADDEVRKTLRSRYRQGMLR
jgi:hypothetical protein